MITVEAAKKLARELSSTTPVAHSVALEAIARASGFRDWNTMVAVAGRTTAGRTSPYHSTAGVAEPLVVPILRVFDHEIARSFYCGYLGFEWQWEHRFEPDLPVYAQVSLDGCVLHLSEHHGDATPGGAVMLVVPDLVAYREVLLAKAHPNSRPGIDRDDWGLTMLVVDPFGNRLTFWQRTPDEDRGRAAREHRGGHAAREDRGGRAAREDRGGRAAREG